MGQIATWIRGETVVVGHPPAANCPKCRAGTGSCRRPKDLQLGVGFALAVPARRGEPGRSAEGVIRDLAPTNRSDLRFHDDPLCSLREPRRDPDRQAD